MTEEVNAAQAEPTEPVETMEVEGNATEVTAASDTEVSGEEPQVIEIDEKQKALNKLAFEKREEKRQRIAAEEENARLKAQIPQAVTPQAVPDLPKEADFDYDTDKYQAALAKYNEDMVTIQVAKTLEQQRAQEAQAQEAQRQQKVQATFSQKVAESNIKGYADAITTLPIFDPAVLEAIQQSENGVQVAYYLSQHLDQADAIAMSNPVFGGMKIGEISARLSSVTKQTKPSAAPDPIDPINQGGAAIGDEWSNVGGNATYE